MTATTKKPKKTPASASSNLTDNQDLKLLASIIPDENQADPGQEPGPGQEIPGQAQEKPGVSDAEVYDGGITDILLVIVDFALELNNLSPLTDKQKDRLKRPLIKIEGRYASAVVSKYAGDSAPFVELLLITYSIFKEKRSEAQAKIVETHGPGQE